MNSSVPSLEKNPRDSSFSSQLDFLRAGAAFVVLFGHTRSLFVQRATADQRLSYLDTGLYYLSLCSHLAVMVFFVLSGYLVGGTVIRSVREGRWSWSRYLMQRGTRLYVVLLPALVVTLCWDYATQMQTADLTPDANNAAILQRSEMIHENTGAREFLGNAIYLQTVVVPTLGSNTPLWSLTNEFWYYLLFPMLWLAIAQPRLEVGWRIGFIVSAAVLLGFLGEKIAVYLVIWLLGAVVSHLPECGLFTRDLMRRLATLLALGVLAVLLALIVTGRIEDERLSDFLVAIVFTGLLYCMKHNRLAAVSLSLRRVVGFFADFSYTLYLVHLPALVFLRAYWNERPAWPIGTNTWGKVLAIMAAATVYAFLFSRLTEVRTDRSRRWLESKLGYR